MNDAELKLRLEEIVNKVFSPVNKTGLNISIDKVIKFMEMVSPGAYDELYMSMYGPVVSQDNPIMPLDQRLYNLAVRLENEGLHVNANICFLALDELRKKL